jgi:hypothetical protein
MELRKDCDRCGFSYPKDQIRRQATAGKNLWVCRECFDLPLRMPEVLTSAQFVDSVVNPTPYRPNTMPFLPSDDKWFRPDRKTLTFAADRMPRTAMITTLSGVLSSTLGMTSAAIVGTTLSGAITFGLYPIASKEDTIAVTASIGTGDLHLAVNDYTLYDSDTFTATAAMGTGSLNLTLQDYTLYDSDTFTATATMGTGTLVVTLQDYTLYDSDTFTATATIGTGTLAVTLTDHTLYDSDTFTSTATIGTGTLV